MNERQIKIVEGLKSLVDGLLDEASVFADDVRGVEGFEDAPYGLVNEAKSLIELAKGPYYKQFFPKDELRDLELKYRLISGKVEGVAGSK